MKNKIDVQEAKKKTKKTHLCWVYVPGTSFRGLTDKYKYQPRANDFAGCIPQSAATERRETCIDQVGGGAREARGLQV